MLTSKLKIAAVLLVSLSILAVGAGLFTWQARAEPVKPAKPQPAADGVKKEKKEQGPFVHGVVKLVDAGKTTITVTVAVLKDGIKETKDETFELAKDGKVYIADFPSKDKPLPEGKLGDLIAGTQVQVLLTADKKHAASITARGPGLQSSVKAIDTTAKTLTVAIKDKNGAGEKTVTLANDIKVRMSEGLKKDEKEQEGRVADLTEGTPIHVQLSVDQKTAVSIRVQGATLQGILKGFDAGNNQITITVKEDGALVDKNFPVIKDARVVDLQDGLGVRLRFSVFEKGKVAVAEGQGQKDSK